MDGRLEEARPPHAGPQPQGHADLRGSDVRQARCSAQPSPSRPIVQLAVTVSKAPCGGVATRSAAPTLDPAPTRMDSGTCEGERSRLEPQQAVIGSARHGNHVRRQGVQDSCDASSGRP
jgi:hypothetical protein